MNSEAAAKEFASEDKDKNLTSAIGLLEKKYGKGAIMSLAGDTVDRIEAYPTGSLGLDIALGIGGLPKGRICEVYGPESSGKTTLALHLAAEVQKQGGTVVFIDAEHALDVNYARKLGVDTSKLLVSQPDCGEQALEIAETLIQSGSVSLVVIDSVAALVPRAEIDGEMDDLQPGMQARLMSKALRKLTALVARAGCQVLFINQIRMKIGVMFGSPETTTGGNALKFYSSVRLDVRRVGALKGDGDVVLGNRTRVKVVKNKVAPPFRETEFDIIFNEGISQLGEIIDMGVEKGIIDKMGSWFSFRGERLGQGREGAKQFLREHPEVASELRSLILQAYGIGADGSSKDAAVGSKVSDPTKAVAVTKSDDKGKVADDKSAKAVKKKGELNGAAAHS